MEKTEVPITPAVRTLRQKGIGFVPHFYAYEEHGGTGRAADQLKVSEHLVIKTLIMESESGRPFVVLQHGDFQVSTKQLARTLEVKRVIPCDEGAAQRHTGYQVGGISPLGTKKIMPVYAEKSILSLEKMYINGGKRGFLIEVKPSDLLRILPVKEVEASVKK